MTTRSVHPPRHHRPSLSALAQLISGDLLALPPTCLAFAIHPDRTVVVTTAHGRTVTLQPTNDGLYDVDRYVSLTVATGQTR